ncbi:DUF6090 family protein [Robiginitalea sp. SC105]|uniref:DUF6090 family protein n=1 Tax=Robiginitalea sp. SC105 TaxID=2762332 RepID=UPI001C8E9336|nr:DUF6090 family protein [Robiginitalea sp. SC105]
MIKFFRQIRIILLTDGKFSKYLLYAIGEIMLVVIGILIALQINNWNEEKINRTEIKLNLENLADAIIKDDELLREIEGNNEFRLISLQHLLRLINVDTHEADTIAGNLNSQRIWNGAIPDTFNLEFNQKTFTWINRPRAMIIHDYAMEEFKSTGSYSQLKNQKLKNLLSDYYSALDWHFGSDGISNSSLQDLNDYIRDTYSFLMSDIPGLRDPIAFIKNDPALVVRLREVKDNASWRLTGAIKGRTMARRVLEEIETEISSYK